MLTGLVPLFAQASTRATRYKCDLLRQTKHAFNYVSLSGGMIGGSSTPGSQSRPQRAASNAFLEGRTRARGQSRARAGTRSAGCGLLVQTTRDYLATGVIKLLLYRRRK